MPRATRPWIGKWKFAAVSFPVCCGEIEHGRGGHLVPDRGRRDAVAGVVLQQTSETIVKQLGMSGVVFGATILGAVTALPEISSRLAAVELGDHKLAISDILGGNAFLPVIFLVATLVSGKALLPHATKADMYLTALGMLLTSVYIYGLIFRPRRQIARMGIDSFVVLILYVVGVAGLFAIK
jgi:cation:H+ antiporter